MNEFLLIASGGLFVMALDFVYQFWRRSHARQKRREAERVLKQHELYPQLYLAGMDEEDPELRTALDAYASYGYIITTVDGAVKGKLCPKVVKGPHLRLVVSNDKS